MTTASLALWIAFGIALQLALYLGVVIRNHWKGYRLLGTQVDGGSSTTPTSGPTNPTAVPGWPGLRQMVVARKVFEDARKTVCSFHLVPEDGLPLPDFLPGQFLTFRLMVPRPDGGSEHVVRCYSLSGAPASDHYRISVKRIPAPPGTNAPAGVASNYLHDHAEVGSRLEVRAPSGHFHIDRSDAPVVLIAGGIGITPMLSMIDWCVRQQPAREIWLFYGVRHSGEAVMLAHLDALAASHPPLHLRICYSDPLPGDLASGPGRLPGRVDINQLRMHLPLKPYHYYLCGPRAMMEGLVPSLEEWGVAASHIHFEAFGPSSVKRRAAPSDAPPGASSADAITVTFRRSGKQLAWDPQARNLLEFAESHGISIASGCRAGGCGTCQTAVVSGEVVYSQTPDHDPAPGTCLMCTSTPTRSITLEA